MADEVVFTVEEGKEDANGWKLISREIAPDGAKCDIWVSGHGNGRSAHVCVALSDTKGVELTTIPWKSGAGRAECDKAQKALIAAHTPKVAVPAGAPDNWASMSKKQQKAWLKANPQES